MNGVILKSQSAFQIGYPFFQAHDSALQKLEIIGQDQS
ncbi:hypothetical protein EMIT048CA2_50070 [Pseudomonas chlororaphis]